MRHRQHREPFVLLARFEGMICSKDIMHQIAVAEHNALGIARGAGSIYEGRKVVCIRLYSAAITGERIVIASDNLKSVKIIHQRHTLKAILWHLGRKLAADEEHLCLGMLQNIAHFVFGTVRKDRDNHPSECHGREKGDAPIRHTLAKQGNSGSAAYSVTRHTSGQSVAGAAELSISVSEVSIT